MEKFGLFDLIDKLNSSASGKKEFKKGDSSQSVSQENQNQKGGLVDPFIYPPKHYMMNEKMIDFCKKHDDFRNTILKESKN